VQHAYSTKAATAAPTSRVKEVETTTEAAPAVLTAELVEVPLPVVESVEPEPEVPVPVLPELVLPPEVELEGATLAVAAEASFLNSVRERVALAAVLVGSC
jgi:hypothetical protein